MNYERIKANDGTTLTFALDPKPTPFASAAYRLRRSTAAGLGAAIVGDVADYDEDTGVVTVVLAPIVLSPAGVPAWYRLEVQVEPGPITYPSGGWFTLYVVPDLG